MASNTFGPGTYTVTLTVSNSLGQVTNAVKPSYVRVVSDATYVSTNGTAQYPYDTWEKATTNPVQALVVLSDAINAGATAGNMWVSGGVYNVGAELIVNQAIQLHGLAGAATTTLRRATAPNRLLTLSNGTALVEGFTITGGSGVTYGGGVYMTAGTLRNCTVATNSIIASPDAAGGGVYANGGTISNCVIVGNDATAAYNQNAWGGGIYASGGTTVRECRVTGNLAKGYNGAAAGPAYGGGIYMTGTPRVWNCLVTSNRVYRNTSSAQWEQGGGVWMNGGTLLNCTVADNWGVLGTSSGGEGAGVYQAGGGVTNCVIYFNTAIAAVNNFFSSAGGNAYNCASELIGGAPNLAGDPQFVARTNQDYHLLSSSLCVDAGTNLTVVTQDLDGNARPLDGNNDSNARHDMGCYELVPSAALSCNFSGSPLLGVSTLSNVVFTATIGGAAGVTNIQYYWWDFGAGTTPQAGAALVTASNTFGPGSYTVTLTVSNSLGQVASASVPNYVRVVSAVTYVSTNGTGQYPYDTWAKATNDPVQALAVLSDAITLGAAAGNLWASGGVYTVGSELTLNQPIQLHGVNGADATTLRRGAALVRIVSMSNATALVEGFTITGGSGATSGGGVYMTAGTLRNCTVTNNSPVPGGWANGGGVYALGGVVSNCVITRNSAAGDYNSGGVGGGIYAGGMAIVRDCRITANSAKDVNNGANGAAYGGGVYMTATSQVCNCLIASNSVQRNTVASQAEQGGGVWINGGTLLNCTVADNWGVLGTGSGLEGGGVYQAGGGITNCAIGGNVTNQVSPVTNNYSATAGSIVYSCAPELTNGTGNIAADPVFRRLGTLDYYSASRGSPTLNSGLNIAWMRTAVDLMGTPRIQNGHVDMGAFEGPVAGTAFTFH